MRKVFLWAVAGLGTLALLGAATSAERGVQQVEVINFPEVQHFEGDLQVKGPIAHSQLLRRTQIIVPPVPRDDTTNLIQVEPVETAGFTNAVLNLQGEIKSGNFSPGEVGVVLIPEEEAVLRAFREDGSILFPLEISTRPSPGGPRYFTAKTVRSEVGFPRYRIYLYNGTDKSAELNVYLYLTH